MGDKVVRDDRRNKWKTTDWDESWEGKAGTAVARESPGGGRPTETRGPRKNVLGRGNSSREGPEGRQCLAWLGNHTAGSGVDAVITGKQQMMRVREDFSTCLFCHFGPEHSFPGGGGEGIQCTIRCLAASLVSIR